MLIWCLKKDRIYGIIIQKDVERRALMKKTKSKSILVIQKFHNSQKITGLMLIMFFVILILYIIVLILLQVDSVSETQLFSDKLIVLLNVLKDFFLVIISIIGTTLLTSTIIEKNQKNTT